MGSPWSLSRLEVRAPLVAGGDPFARVELVHDQRGRVTDIGRGAGPLDSIFNAIGQIVGLDAVIRSIDVDYRPSFPEARTTVTTRITLDVEGEIRSGSAIADDLLISCISAYLEAAASSSGNAG